MEQNVLKIADRLPLEEALKRYNEDQVSLEREKASINMANGKLEGSRTKQYKQLYRCLDRGKLVTRFVRTLRARIDSME